MSARSIACVVAALAQAACSAPDPGERARLVMPPFESFPPVGEALGTGCGSLDCHGNIARNFRLYDGNGLRLRDDFVSGGGLTTDDELAENYRAFVLFEPELTSLVFRQKGAGPDRLTIVRKGRGTENHKGGAAMTVNGATDVCLTSYLAGSMNFDACTVAAEVLRPK